MNASVAKFNVTPALQAIFDRYPADVTAYAVGDDIGDDFMEELVAYFTETQEIPYGTAKARDGDPFVWVFDYLENFIPFCWKD